VNNNYSLVYTKFGRLGIEKKSPCKHYINYSTNYYAYLYFIPTALILSYIINIFAIWSYSAVLYLYCRRVREHIFYRRSLYKSKRCLGISNLKRLNQCPITPIYTCSRNNLKNKQTNIEILWTGRTRSVCCVRRI